MKRKKADISAFDAKVFLEKQRHADPKTGHSDTTMGTKCFAAIKAWMKQQEPDCDPWDQRVSAALNDYDERHKPAVSGDPEQPRLLQPEAEWKLDRNRRITIPEGKANGDDIDLRQTVIRSVFEDQKAIFDKEDTFLSESKRRGRRKDNMLKRWEKPGK